MLKIAALALLMLLPNTAFAATVEEVDQAISDNLGDPAAYHEAFDALQQAVAADDPAEIAKWVQFPINVRIADKAVTLDDVDAFVKAYPDFFSQDIKDAVTGQKFEDLLISYQGAMFGNGQVWINGTCRTDACEYVDVRVITIQEAAAE